MVHSVSDSQRWPTSHRQGIHNMRHQLANHLLLDQESLYNASRGAQCQPFDNIPARDVGVALRLLADQWLYERQVGMKMRTIADEVNARHQNRRRYPDPSQCLGHCQMVGRRNLFKQYLQDSLKKQLFFLIPYILCTAVQQKKLREQLTPSIDCMQSLRSNNGHACTSHAQLSANEWSFFDLSEGAVGACKSICKDSCLQRPISQRCVTVSRFFCYSWHKTRQPACAITMDLHCDVVLFHAVSTVR